MRVLFLTLMLVTAVARGEIFADIEVSQGEDPLGTIRIRLEHEKVPRVVAAFIGLATGERDWIDPVTNEVKSGVPYYDGVIFHRLIHNFVIQGGDPTGTGQNGPGYVTQDQFHPDLRHSGRYMVSTAKSTNPNTFGSQFFITLEAAGHLDDKHSVFGEVISDETYPDSRALIDSFTSVADFPVINQRPDTPLTMTSVRISGSSLAGFDINDPSLRMPYIVQDPVKPFPIRTGADDIFTLRFKRESLHDYFLLSGSELDSLPLLSTMLSADQEEGYLLDITGVDEQSFYYRHTVIDYSQLFHPLPSLNQNGATIEFVNPDGSSITVVSDGEGAGTWSDSDGNSGNLSSFIFDVSLPETGVFFRNRSLAEFIPLLNFDCEFPAPAGTGAFESLSGVLSFHSDINGGFEGGKNSSTAFNRPFNFTPAPGNP
ncbi:peptidylprolyl isomerase [Akkermansiaceae bacterium]|nr:peptidylprolyl isomerase [Akkermansiaceae bacterium]